MHKFYDFLPMFVHMHNFYYFLPMFVHMCKNTGNLTYLCAYAFFLFCHTIKPRTRFLFCSIYTTFLFSSSFLVHYFRKTPSLHAPCSFTNTFNVTAQPLSHLPSEQHFFVEICCTLFISPHKNICYDIYDT